MLELIIVAFIFWLGYNVGQMVLSWQLRDIIRKEAIQNGMKVDSEYNIIKEENPKVCKLWAEKIHDILYLYEDDKQTFVCQGSTVQDLASLALKYKNIKYASVIVNEEVYAFVDGVAKPASEVLK
jgi:hypothetical protein